MMVRRRETGMSPNRVSFDKVEVLEFPRVLGDNPSVSVGVPVALDARLLSKHVLLLEDYELRRRPRRDACELKLDRDEREDLMLSIGYSYQDIAKAIRQCRKLRHGREHSYYNKQWDGFHWKLEKCRRSVASIFRRNRTQDDTWIHYHPSKQRLPEHSFHERPMRATRSLSW